MGNSSTKAPSPPPPPPTPPIRRSATPPARTPSPPQTSYTSRPTTSYTSRPTTSYTSRPTTSYTSRPTTSPSTPAATKPAVPAHQVVRHVANNYIIPAVSRNDPHQVQKIQAPPYLVADKLCLRVCPQYNSRDGCMVPLCRRLHVCFFWTLKDNCQRSNCEYDHTFASSHNRMILDLFSKEKGVAVGVVIAALRDNHKHKRDNENNLICIYSIMRKCNKNPCNLVHANKSYRWEVCDRNNWIQFSYKLNDFLEQVYCDPSQSSIELPPFPQNQRLESLLSQSSWTLDFDSLQLISKESSLPVRRLSTSSDIVLDLRLATRWLWYWQDDDGSWKQYDSGTLKYFVLSLGDQFEYYRHFGRKDSCNYQIGEHAYELSLSKMQQVNQSTHKARKVRRRPFCIKMKNGQTQFEKLFITLPINKKFTYFPVLTSTSEFVFIENMMKLSLPFVNITSIKRIQNDHLWKAYQNKKKLLLSLYNGDIAKINEQYLFHGTKHSVIDQISSDNLDWRLYGSNVGHVFGQGVYFTNMASVSDSYSETKSNERAVFVVYVLVGTMTVGNRSIEIPPVNPETGRHFDTTCNNATQSTIFVKYYRDEYYPAYIVRYCKSNERY